MPRDLLNVFQELDADGKFHGGGSVDRLTDTMLGGHGETERWSLALCVRMDGNTGKEIKGHMERQTGET